MLIIKGPPLELPFFYLKFSVLYTPPCSPSRLQADSALIEDSLSSPSKVWGVRGQFEDILSPSEVLVIQVWADFL